MQRPTILAILDAVEKHRTRTGQLSGRSLRPDERLRGQVDRFWKPTRAGSFLERLTWPAEPIDTISHLAEAQARSSARTSCWSRSAKAALGVVYLAEQERPVRRRVALKIIKPGMDTRQVIARFEAERQALAMMDHPNIAKVLDAGTTDTGRPYFVMELVHGIPITEYCDQCNLTIRERLELFVPVCQAVQHAHQKGIIHRDIKPTNVLVTMHDGRPSPKVIDFGVAKALGPAAHRAHAVHGVCPDRRHAALHEPRAGRAEPARRRHAQRHLFAGRAALRVAHRHDALRQGPPARGLLRRDAADHPRRRAAAAQRADQHTRSRHGARTVAEHRRTDPRRLSQQSAASWTGS